MGKLINDNRQYTEDVEIVSYSTDRQEMALPSSLLKFFQEIAGAHSDVFGFGFEDLSKKNATFLLVNVSVNIIKTPRLHQKLSITTWSVGKKGIRYLRRTKITDENGEVMAYAESVWILVDTLTHKIITKGEDINFNIPEFDEKFDDLRCGKIDLPDEMILQGKRRIRYTDIDYNGHLNNCKYADFVMDFMPVDLIGKRVSALDIYFHAEAMEGDKIEIYTGEKNGFIYFHGVNKDSVCFDARCKLENM